MKTVYLSAAVAMFVAGAAQALPVNWVDWTDRVDDANGTTITGTMTVGMDSVTVTYNNPVGIAFAQLTGTGIDYWVNRVSGRNDATSPYTSIGASGVDNTPTGTDIIALQNAGNQTLTFSQAVSDIYFSFVSLNSNGYAFDRDFTILSGGNQNFDGNGTDACGYWGCGTSSKSIVGAEYQLIGTGEPHGTILLDGSFTSVSWRSLSNEYWNGFTVGAKGLTPPSMPSVPLPAGGLLLITGLGALALRRKRG